MDRGFSMNAIIQSQKVEKVLREYADWMQYEYLEIKSMDQREYYDYDVQFIFNDAVNYLVLCDKIIQKREGDLVFYKLEVQDG